MSAIPATTTTTTSNLSSLPLSFVTINSSDGFSFVVAREVASVSGRRKKKKKKKKKVKFSFAKEQFEQCLKANTKNQQQE
jgi:hypothetical protein